MPCAASVVEGRIRISSKDRTFDGGRLDRLRFAWRRGLARPAEQDLALFVKRRAQLARALERWRQADLADVDAHDVVVRCLWIMMWIVL